MYSEFFLLWVRERPLYISDIFIFYLSYIFMKSLFVRVNFVCLYWSIGTFCDQTIITNLYIIRLLSQALHCKAENVSFLVVLLYFLKFSGFPEMYEMRLQVKTGHLFFMAFISLLFIFVIFSTSKGYILTFSFMNIRHNRARKKTIPLKKIHIIHGRACVPRGVHVVCYVHVSTSASVFVLFVNKLLERRTFPLHKLQTMQSLIV